MTTLNFVCPTALNVQIEINTILNSHLSLHVDTYCMHDGLA